MLYWFLRFLSFVILKIIFGLEVRGKENLPRKGGFILASNHVSYLDPIVVGVASPRRLNYMARHDLFSNRLFAWLLNSISVFPVKRDSADLWALKEAMKRVNRGGGLVIFPEGRRSETSASSRIEPGIGFLASKLNNPVIPAFVKGTQAALPKGAKFIKPAKISVSFGKEIPIERGVPYQELALLIMENIRHLSCY